MRNGNDQKPASRAPSARMPARNFSRRLARPQQEQQDRPDDGEDRGQEVAEPGDGQEHARQHPVPAGVEAAGHDAEEQQGERQADREGELPGQRRGDVPAVDRERPVEEERHRDHRQQRRSREAHAGQAPEGVGGQREGDQAEDGDQLEGHPVGQDQVEGDHHQGGKREVEVVGGEAVVPVGRPAGDAAVGQEVVAQVVGAPHVGAGVAAGRRRVRQQQRRLQLEQHEQHRRPDDAEGDDRLRGDPRQPGLEVLDHRRSGPCGANRRLAHVRHLDILSSRRPPVVSPDGHGGTLCRREFPGISSDPHRALTLRSHRGGTFGPVVEESDAPARPFRHPFIRGVCPPPRRPRRGPGRSPAGGHPPDAWAVAA